MPNWCRNRLTISAEPETMKAIIADIRGANGHLSFNALIPMPDIVRNTGTGLRDFEVDGKIVTHRVWREEYREEGGIPEARPLTPDEQRELDAAGGDWYRWAVANWGTKWDACHTDPIELSDEDDYIEVWYETAWSPPEPWIKALRAKYPEADITAFYDEPGAQAAGYI